MTYTLGNPFYRVLTLAGCLVLIFLWGRTTTIWGADTDSLLPQQGLRRFGLERMWFNQLPIDVNKTRVLYTLYGDNQLIVVTDDARIHAVNGESGKTMWSRKLGRDDLLTLEPSMNSEMVAIIHGLEVLVYDRSNGKLVWNTDLGEVPGAGCELGENFLFVPLLMGKMLAFHLEIITGRTVQPTKQRPLQTATGAGNGTDRANSAGLRENSEALKEIKTVQEAFDKRRRSIMEEEKPQAEPLPLSVMRGGDVIFATSSFGKTLVQPLYTGLELTARIVEDKKDGTNKIEVSDTLELIVWVTDKGILHVGSIDVIRGGAANNNLVLRYQVESQPQSYYLGSTGVSTERTLRSGNEVVARPSMVPQEPPVCDSKDISQHGLVLVGTVGGDLIATKYLSGEHMWTFLSTAPILGRVAVIGNNGYKDNLNEYMHEVMLADIQSRRYQVLPDVYVPTAAGIYCLHAANGKSRWFSPGISTFFMASKTRLYGLSNTNELTILDRATGGILASFPAERFVNSVFNEENDRLFLMTNTGLVQCLTELRVEGADTEPVKHRWTASDHLEMRAIFRDGSHIRTDAQDSPDILPGTIGPVPAMKEPVARPPVEDDLFGSSSEGTPTPPQQPQQPVFDENPF